MPLAIFFRQSLVSKEEETPWNLSGCLWVLRPGWRKPCGPSSTSSILWGPSLSPEGPAWLTDLSCLCANLLGNCWHAHSYLAVDRYIVQLPCAVDIVVSAGRVMGRRAPSTFHKDCHLSNLFGQLRITLITRTCHSKQAPFALSRRNPPS